MSSGAVIITDTMTLLFNLLYVFSPSASVITLLRYIFVFAASCFIFTVFTLLRLPARMFTSSHLYALALVDYPCYM